MLEPLTPPDLDLRDFTYMPLEVVRLRDSDIVVIASGEEFRAAVLLWCAAWHQVPAASLPNDERILANLAGFGRDLKGWRTVRSAAMRGFVECSDGRLYHPVIAEKAIESGSKKRSHRAQTAAATEARRLAKEQRDDQRNDKRDDQRNVQRNDKDDAQRNVHQGKGRDSKGEEKKEDAASAAILDFGKPEPPPPPSLEKQYFDRSVDVLGKDGRSLAAKLLKAKSGQIPLARAALEQASTKTDPREYVGACIRGNDPGGAQRGMDPRF